MSEGVVVIIALVVFLLLIMSRVPIGFGLAAAGSLGIALMDGFSVATGTLASVPFSSSAKYTFIVIPLFIFMGVLIAETGIAKEIFTVADRMLGKLPGGLAIAAIAASAMFGAVSGSSSATSATMGKVSLTEMKRLGYPAPFAAATIAVAGTLAVLIPPSIVLVVYGILTGESIGKLLIAAIIPGILSAVVLMGYVVIRALIWKRKGIDTQANRAKIAAAELRASGPIPTELIPTAPRRWYSGLSGLFYIALLFGLVMGGIYTGIFTASEAAGIGALGAIIIGLIHLRKSKQIVKPFVQSLRETATMNGMIFAILLGGGIFSVFLVTTGIPGDITSWVVSLDAPPLVIVGLILLAMIPLGMFLDGLSMMVIAVPLVYPVITAMGLDGIWFGILIVITFEIGLITPPVGLNVFVMAGLKGAPPAEKIFASAAGYVLVEIVIVAILFIFPGLVTWLPQLMSQ